MKLPRRTFSHLAAGAAALPNVSGIAGGNVSDGPDHDGRAVSRGRPVPCGRMRKVLGRPVVIDALFVAGASQLGERK